MLDDTITTPAWAMRLKADIDFKGLDLAPLQAGDWVIVDPNADFVSGKPYLVRLASGERQIRRLAAADETIVGRCTWGIVSLWR